MTQDDTLKNYEATLRSILNEDAKSFDYRTHFNSATLENLSRAPSPLNKFSGRSQYNVYKVKPMDSPTPVALKVKKSTDDGHYTHNLQEVVLLKYILCSHENVVRLLDVHMSNRTIFLVFPLYPKTLHHIVTERDEPLDEVFIKRVLSDVLEGLWYCHSRRVLHADIKADNILITTEGRAVITDFGSSIMLPLPPQVKISYNVNPMGYKPVEAILEQPLDFTTDIWALGCTIVACFQKKRPVFTGATPQDQLDVIHLFAGPISDELWNANPTWGRPRPSSIVYPKGQVMDFDYIFRDVPPALRRLLRNLLHPDPTCRYMPRQALADPYFW